MAEPFGLIPNSPHLGSDEEWSIPSLVRYPSHSGPPPGPATPGGVTYRSPDATTDRGQAAEIERWIMRALLQRANRNWGHPF